jgi:hypothetical protein
MQRLAAEWLMREGLYPQDRDATGPEVERMHRLAHLLVDVVVVATKADPRRRIIPTTDDAIAYPVRVPDTVLTPLRQLVEAEQVVADNRDTLARRARRFG